MAKLAKKTKPIVRRAKSPKTFEEIRDVIRKFFKNANSEETQRLWNVLSALRGPDTTNSTAMDVKNATTAVIRHAFLGDATEEVTHAVGVVIRKDSADAKELRHSDNGDKVEDVAGYHFLNHVSDAFAALKLDW